MKFHNITPVDLLNGDGLRVVLWLSGCEIHCPNCQNPQTWDPNDGIEFDEKAKEELFSYLDKDYIAGVTFSGGHPLHPNNVKGVLDLIDEIRNRYPSKTIWTYTGYDFDKIVAEAYLEAKKNKKELSLAELRYHVLIHSDVVVDGAYREEEKDVNYHWAGSKNQRVIDVSKTKENLQEMYDSADAYPPGLGGPIDKLAEVFAKCIVLHDNI